jgi:16S rRNA (guanine527-N7)-methyltransferase|uniref:Ribosomal RNA small subunit methyltransferase G n=1 Tax=candidate division WOR-3 bacterium TaxID=2052148 RepID=A0A7C6EHR8_UNCW3
MLSIENEIRILKDGFLELGIEPREDIFNKFRIYLKVLYNYKNHLHLISHNDYKRISLKHFLPSLMILRFISNQQNACDIGAGAGFPSIPVKILVPEINFTLFESIKKKAIFLSYLIKELNLSGIKVISERAEKYQVENFDLILIRAAGRIKDLIKTIDHLIKPGGKAVFYKTQAVEEEIRQAKDKIDRMNFSITIENLYTPVEKIPMSLVFLTRKCFP